MHTVMVELVDLFSTIYKINYSSPVELLENPHGLLSTQLDGFQILKKCK